MATHLLTSSIKSEAKDSVLPKSDIFCQGVRLRCKEKKTIQSHKSNVFICFSLLFLRLLIVCSFCVGWFSRYYGASSFMLLLLHTRAHIHTISDKPDAWSHFHLIKLCSLTLTKHLESWTSLGSCCDRRIFIISKMNKIITKI